MVALGQLAVRSLQFLWTLLITALIGSVIAGAFAGNPSSINYAMFVAVFSWVAVIFGFAVAFIDGLSTMTMVLLAVDGLATLFTFVAGVTLAAKLGVHSCGRKSYVTANSLTNGSHNPTKRCHELQASTAFFWFLFASYFVVIGHDFSGLKGLRPEQCRWWSQRWAVPCPRSRI